jgi:hypothetical protein
MCELNVGCDAPPARETPLVRDEIHTDENGKPYLKTIPAGVLKECSKCGAQVVFE